MYPELNDRGQPFIDIDTPESEVVRRRARAVAEGDTASIALYEGWLFAHRKIGETGEGGT